MSSDSGKTESAGTKQHLWGERIRNSVATKLTLWFLLLAMVPLAVFFIFISPHVNDAFMSAASEHMAYEARLLGAGISFLNSEDEMRAVVVNNSDEGHVSFIIDKNGLYTIHPDKAKINTSMRPDFSAKTTEEILSNNEGVTIDENFIIGYSAMPAKNMIGVVVMNKSQITKKMVSMENAAFIQLSISLVIIALAGGALIWFLVGPMYKLRGFAQEVGAGNLNVRIEPSEFDGELEALATAFKQMTIDLKKSREQIGKHTEELEQRVQERTKELGGKVDELIKTKTAILNMMEDMDETNKELIKTKHDLEKSLGELREMDVKKDQFISIAAHELKTPLTSIHGFSQLLQNRKIGNDFSKRNEYLKIMDHESKRLAKLVNDILNLSRIDLGTMKLTVEKVDLNEFMQSIEKEMGIQIKEKGLESKFEVGGKLPRINTDREKLTEILINLISNAVKYTPKGLVTITMNLEGGDVHFCVKDTGIGISRIEQGKIFERFYQVDSSYTRKAGGAGLGLALCKEYVGIMGGTMWVKSRAGRGTEFHFTLPVKGVPKTLVMAGEKMAEEALKKSEGS